MEDSILKNIIPIIDKEERYNLFITVDKLLQGNYIEKAKALQVKQSAYYQYKKKFLFCWDDKNIKLKKFLRNVNWVKTAKIDRLDDKTIQIKKNLKFISLKLNDEKTKVNMTIDGIRTDEFFVRQENGKLQIYKKNLEISDDKTILLLNLLYEKDKGKFTEFLIPIVVKAKKQFSILEDCINSGLDFKIFEKLFSIYQRYEAKKQELEYLRIK